jgi:hypothetical protein
MKKIQILKNIIISIFIIAISLIVIGLINQRQEKYKERNNIPVEIKEITEDEFIKKITELNEYTNINLDNESNICYENIYKPDNLIICYYNNDIDNKITKINKYYGLSNDKKFTYKNYTTYKSNDSDITLEKIKINDTLVTVLYSNDYEYEVNTILKELNYKRNEINTKTDKLLILGLILLIVNTLFALITKYNKKIYKFIKNRNSTILIVISLIPITLTIIYSIIAYFTGFTFFLTTDYGLDATIGVLVIFIYAFWPIYLLSLILLTLGIIIKVKNKKKTANKNKRSR